MKMTTNTKIKIIFVAFVFLFVSKFAYADDWLELVQQYTSADKVNFAPSEWDQMVNEHSGKENLNRNVLAQWWDTFNDETLTKLIEMAFKANKDMESARARLEEARAQLGITMGNLSPVVDGKGSYTHREPSKNAGGGRASKTYHVALDASWELDLWGKVADNIKASKADYEAEFATLHNSWVSLSAEVAQNYINIRTLQARIKVANDNIALQQDIYDLQKSQFEAGLKGEMDLQQSRYNLEITKSNLPALEQALAENMNALAILTGEVPGSINEMLKDFDGDNFPKLDIMRLNGIPAETIRQRPDIQKAEQNLIAQRTRVKSAKKEYYPTISFSGSIGLDSLSSEKFLKSSSFTSLFTPSISFPIFRDPRISRNIKVQSAREKQYLAAYEKTVLNAVSEVRNALTANVQEEIKNQSLKEGFEAAKGALDIAQDKYKQGLTDFNNVLTAMQSVYSFENNLTISNGQKMLNLVSLFKALGGGWQPMEQE